MEHNANILDFRKMSQKSEKLKIAKVGCGAFSMIRKLFVYNSLLFVMPEC